MESTLYGELRAAARGPFSEAEKATLMRAIIGRWNDTSPLVNSALEGDVFFAEKLRPLTSAFNHEATIEDFESALKTATVLDTQHILNLREPPLSGFTTAPQPRRGNLYRQPQARKEIIRESMAFTLVLVICLVVYVLVMAILRDQVWLPSAVGGFVFTLIWCLFFGFLYLGASNSLRTRQRRYAGKVQAQAEWLDGVIADARKPLVPES